MQKQTQAITAQAVLAASAFALMIGFAAKAVQPQLEPAASAASIQQQDAHSASGLPGVPASPDRQRQFKNFCCLGDGGCLHWSDSETWLRLCTAGRGRSRLPVGRTDQGRSFSRRARQSHWNPRGFRQFDPSGQHRNCEAFIAVLTAHLRSARRCSSSVKTVPNPYCIVGLSRFELHAGSAL